MAFSDAYLFKNSSTFCLSLNVRLWMGWRLVLPCTRAVRPFWSSARPIICTFCLPTSCREQYRIRQMRLPLNMYVCFGLNRFCSFISTHALVFRWASSSVFITRSGSSFVNSWQYNLKLPTSPQVMFSEHFLHSRKFFFLNLTCVCHSKLSDWLRLRIISEGSVDLSKKHQHQTRNAQTH